MQSRYQIGEAIRLPDGSTHQEVADDIAQTCATTPSRKQVERFRWPGRRADDHRAWVMAIVVALLATAALAVPDEYRIAPPTTHHCTPASAR